MQKDNTHLPILIILYAFLLLIKVEVNDTAKKNKNIITSLFISNFTAFVANC